MTTQRVRKVLNINEAADYLGISRTTLYALFARGELTWVRPSPGRRGVTVDELDRHIRKQTAA